MNHMGEGTRLLDARWSGTFSGGFHLLGAFLGSVPNSLEMFHEWLIGGFDGIRIQRVAGKGKGMFEARKGKWNALNRACVANTGINLSAPLNSPIAD